MSVRKLRMNQTERKQCREKRFLSLVRALTHTHTHSHRERERERVKHDFQDIVIFVTRLNTMHYGPTHTHTIFVNADTHRSQTSTHTRKHNF